MPQIWSFAAWAEKYEKQYGDQSVPITLTDRFVASILVSILFSIFPRFSIYNFHMFSVFFHILTIFLEGHQNMEKIWETYETLEKALKTTPFYFHIFKNPGFHIYSILASTKKNQSLILAPSLIQGVTSVGFREDWGIKWEWKACGTTMVVSI